MQVLRTAVSRIPKGSSAVAATRAFSAKKEWVPDCSMDTQLVHGVIDPCEKTGAILTPVYLSTTFVQDSVDKYLDKGYSYSRTNNPTVSVLEEKVALMERSSSGITESLNIRSR